MPTPTGDAIYGADSGAMAAAALAILVALLRKLAQKRSLSPDDVDAVLAAAERMHTGSRVEARSEAAALIGQMRRLID